jgi:hypothetical protein
MGYKSEALSLNGLPGEQYQNGECAVLAATSYIQDLSSRGLVWVDTPYSNASALESQIDKLNTAMASHGSQGLLLILTQGSLCELRRLLSVRQTIRWERSATADGEEFISWTEEQENALIREAAHVIAGALFLRRGTSGEPSL